MTSRKETEQLIELLYTKDAQDILLAYAQKLDKKNTGKLAVELHNVFKNYKTTDILPTLLLYTVELVNKSYEWQEVKQKQQDLDQMYH